jgi:hypothetical protein
LVIEHGVNRKAVADPVPLGLAVDAQNVFHAASMDAPEYGIK